MSAIGALAASAASLASAAGGADEGCTGAAGALCWENPMAPLFDEAGQHSAGILGTLAGEAIGRVVAGEAGDDGDQAEGGRLGSDQRSTRTAP